MFSSYSYLIHFLLLVSFYLVYLVRLVCRLSLFFSVRFVLCYTASFVVCVLVRLLCACRALSISCVVCPVCFVLIVTLCISNLSFLSVLLFFVVRPVRLVCPSCVFSFFSILCVSCVVYVGQCFFYISCVLFCLFLPYSPLVEFFISPVFCSACFFHIVPW